MHPGDLFDEVDFALNVAVAPPRNGHDELAVATLRALEAEAGEQLARALLRHLEPQKVTNPAGAQPQRSPLGWPRVDIDSSGS
ncbi:hypothetical protein HRbin41_00926 [bacterium HR41]|nr:hypothetical protein HRbin41_00926 [bacterium HR41]